MSTGFDSNETKVTKTVFVFRIACSKTLRLFFYFILFFFSIQRAYGTLKQNLVKFQYTEVIN